MLANKCYKGKCFKIPRIVIKEKPEGVTFSSDQLNIHCRRTRDLRSQRIRADPGLRSLSSLLAGMPVENLESRHSANGTGGARLLTPPFLYVLKSWDRECPPGRSLSFPSLSLIPSLQTTSSFSRYQ